ncbi:hypothetical protein GCK72_024147 [Caenorhabditis remanei]|uniref:DUF38 domain-containing protein n=1 Tax=Caenorhabditis remanei TaxID=31234 RepID=A0A6A5FYY8_CAERE|nr:hypothetical protein GCK72_024147 [Caenorhabditis remanei]KAF1747681.1 hypothetical protein GCK72_024147 [Caenorhabditis remanei]
MDLEVDVADVPTNWCHMPPEIKLMCIKTMSLMFRFAIWCTSTVEREFINSEKRDLKEVAIINGSLQVYDEDRELKIKTKFDEVEDIEKNRLLLKYILTSCNIETFYLEKSFLDLPQFLDKLVANESVQITYLMSERAPLFDNGWLRFILKKSWKSVSEIDLHWATHVVAQDVDAMFKIASINHAGSVKLHRTGNKYAHMYIKKLIEHDAKINTMYHTEFPYDYERQRNAALKKVNVLRNRFKDREMYIQHLNSAIIVSIFRSFINNNMLLRTNNPEKEIVLRVQDLNIGFFEVSATVVPANLPAEQYLEYLNLVEVDY